MRVRVTLSPAAERDLEEIGDYVAAEFGSNTAYNVIRRIRAKIDLLRDHPSLGMEDERIGNRRRLVARPYLIAYRIAKQSEVEVLADRARRARFRSDFSAGRSKLRRKRHDRLRYAWHQ